LCVRRIDTLHFARRASLDEQLCERAIATADVDPPQARRWCQPVEKNFSCKLASDAHPALVGCSVAKTNGHFAHETLTVAGAYQSQSMTAVSSISTRAFGTLSFLISINVLAGRISSKISLCALAILGSSRMSVA
jgi:hypothetical protein